MGWWLFAVTIGVGGIGVIFGGIVSDKFVGKMGVRSRVACLAISQLIATPFAFGSVAFEPFWAMINLSISYFFGKYYKYIPFSAQSSYIVITKTFIYKNPTSRCSFTLISEIFQPISLKRQLF